MERIIYVPVSVLNQSTTLFNTYIHLVANCYKRSKKVTINTKTLAEQMQIDKRYVVSNIKQLSEFGLCEVSEPNIKQNGKQGAITCLLPNKPGEKYVILSLAVMLDENIPKSFRQYYAVLKSVINLENFTTFKSPQEIQDALKIKSRTYFEFMKFLKQTQMKINDQFIPLLIDASNDKEYKFIMSYEKEVFINHKESKIITTKKAIKTVKEVSDNEANQNIISER